MTQQAAIEHAERLRARARHHKRVEREHRRKAQSTMEELRAFCEAHGITFTLIDRAPRRAESNDRHRRT